MSEYINTISGTESSMNDEDRKALSRIAIEQYAKDPCRICGKP